MLVLVVLAAAHVALGTYLARVFTDRRHWRAEQVIYRLGAPRRAAGDLPESSSRTPNWPRPSNNRN